MKLLEVHVENFGKLSHFNYSFEDGLNVLKEPNGFGKSTLAAFIKAMFYGFPGRAGRSVDKNERKKYYPWQGGAYGGYLVFSCEGIQYRVTRFFGKTAARDSFKLEDETHRTESSAYSEQLGEELFQLDAESFSRSTYMPQLMESENGTTASIRARLSNLVDNTDDLDDYDAAAGRLREKRTSLLNYRGSGGKINELKREVREIENALQEDEKNRKPLQETTAEIEQLNKQRHEKEDTLKALREKIRKSALAEKQMVVYRQLEGLRGDVQAEQEQQKKLDAAYPNGYPTETEIEKQRSYLNAYEQAEQALAKLHVSEQDMQQKANGDRLFPNRETVLSDIETCREKCRLLAEQEGRCKNLQVSKEEAEQKARLTQHFQNGIPDEQEWNAWDSMRSQLDEKNTLIGECRMGQKDAQELEALNHVFAGKPLSEVELDACETALRERDRLQAAIVREKPTPAMQKELAHLKEVFSVFVPTEEEIKEQQRLLRRLDALSGKKAALGSASTIQSNAQAALLHDTQAGKAHSDVHAAQSAEITEKHETISQGNHVQGNASQTNASYHHKTEIHAEESRQAKKTSAKLLGVVGILLLAAGVICFILGKFAPGAVLVVFGFAAVLLLMWISMRHVPSQQMEAESKSLSQMAAETQAEVQTQPCGLCPEEECELQKLKEQTSAFIKQFYQAAEQKDAAEALTDLWTDRKRYLELLELQKEWEADEAAYRRQLAHCSRQIADCFQLAGTQETENNGFELVKKIRENWKRWKELSALQKQLAEKRSKLDREREVLEEKLRVVCLSYGYQASLAKNGLAATLQNMRVDQEAWIRLCQREVTLKEQHKQLLQQLETNKQTLSEILSRYEMQVLDGEESEKIVQKLADALKAYEDAKKRIHVCQEEQKEALHKKEQAQAALEAFFQKFGYLQAETRNNELAAYLETNAEYRKTNSQGSAEKIPVSMMQSVLEQMAKDGYESKTHAKLLMQAKNKLNLFLQNHLEINPSWEQEIAAAMEQKKTAALQGTFSDAAQLEEKEKQEQEEKTRIERSLSEKREIRQRLSRIVEGIAEKEDRLARIKSDCQEKEKDQNTLDRALLLLEQAKHNLELRYVEPVEQSFLAYAKELLGTEIGKAELSGELEIRIEEQGEKRETDYFSAGMADMLTICMRLALIDVLFTEEKPFLILDDPFVNLDDAHTKRALSMLENLAKNRQLLYLVCNSSRVLPAAI